MPPSRLPVARPEALRPGLGVSILTSQYPPDPTKGSGTAQTAPDSANFSKHDRYARKIDDTHNTLYAHSSGTETVMVEMDRRNFFRTSAVVTLALGGAAALAACAPETATSTVLRVGSTTDIDSLNPFTAFSTQSYDVLQLLYDKLMDYDADLKIQPSLATKVDVADDGKTFTYTLRDGVKWQDGKDFTADDVVFTFLMVRDNSYGTYGAYFKELTDVIKVGDNQVTPDVFATADPRPGGHHADRAETPVGDRLQGRSAQLRQRQARRHRTRSSTIRGTRAASPPSSATTTGGAPSPPPRRSPGPSSAATTSSPRRSRPAISTSSPRSRPPSSPGSRTLPTSNPPSSNRSRST